MTTGSHEVIDDPRFAPGFRLSMIDVAVLIVGSLFAYSMTGAFSAIGLRIESPIPYQAVGIAIVLPVLAFFLFCNVFRVSRPLELTWAGLYILLITLTVRFETLDWRLAIGLLLFAMITVIVVQIRRPSYHGVGWRWLNPRLPEWWAENVKSPGRGGSA